MPAADLSDSLILVANAGLGQGDPVLSRRMIGVYFRTLAEMGQRPAAIAFYTAGVQLVVDDSPCLAELRALADAGLRLLACRSCLDYYGLIDRVAVGEVGNMAQIIELQAAAARVITV